MMQVLLKLQQHGQLLKELTNDEVAYLEKLANEANVHTLREWEKDMD